jgi:hypothetical protein
LTCEELHGLFHSATQFVKKVRSHTLAALRSCAIRLHNSECEKARFTLSKGDFNYITNYQYKTNNIIVPPPFKKVYWFIMADRLGPEANRFSHLSLRCDAFRNVRICWFPAR